MGIKESFASSPINGTFVNESSINKKNNDYEKADNNNKT